MGRRDITICERPWLDLRRGPLLLFLLAATLPARGQAATWSRSYIRALPDSAFAAIERADDGHTLRHLPHHDRAGHVDATHVRSALSRVTQVHWVNPQRAAAARAHLLRHLRALRTRARSVTRGRQPD